MSPRDGPRPGASQTLAELPSPDQTASARGGDRPSPRSACPALQGHPQIRAWLDLAEFQFDRQVEDRRLGGAQIVLTPGDGLDLDERAETLGQVERDFDLPAEMGQVERSPRLA